MDRRYLEMIALNFGGGPVGVETIAAALSEPRDAIEEIIEPYLIQQGFVQRTPREGCSPHTRSSHLGLAEPGARGAPKAGCSRTKSSGAQVWRKAFAASPCS